MLKSENIKCHSNHRQSIVHKKSNLNVHQISSIKVCENDKQQNQNNKNVCSFNENVNKSAVNENYLSNVMQSKSYSSELTNFLSVKNSIQNYSQICIDSIQKLNVIKQELSNALIADSVSYNTRGDQEMGHQLISDPLLTYIQQNWASQGQQEMNFVFHNCSEEKDDFINYKSILNKCYNVKKKGSANMCINDLMASIVNLKVVFEGASCRIKELWTKMDCKSESTVKIECGPSNVNNCDSENAFVNNHVNIKNKGTMLEYHEKCDIVKEYGLDFDKIRQYCESDTKSLEIDLHPERFKRYRKHFWPNWVYEGDYEFNDHYASLYCQVKESGVPNAKGEMIEVSSNLNIDMWEFYLKDDKYQELLNQIKCGFSLGYAGPVSTHSYDINHQSATRYPKDVEKFIKSEIENGAIIGPFESCPLSWVHINPLMSREKSSSSARRIISDMTWPPEASVNSYVPKTQAFGTLKNHVLPKVDDIVKIVLEKNKQCDFFLSSFDIVNFYKNFRVCPLDFPLMFLKWGGKFYLEVALPFGSRLSSMWMQQVADAIVDILSKKNIISKMYLDDLIILSKNSQQAEKDVFTVHKLFQDLGLPTNPGKNQGPTKVLVWLGVEISLKNFTLAVPSEKLEKTMNILSSVMNMSFLSKEKYESVVGKLLHISKCIVSARIFTSRLLAGLRSAKGKGVELTSSVKEDFQWFLNLSKEWNGIVFLHEKNNIRYIHTHLTEGYIIAYDQKFHYAINVSHIPATHIHHKKWKLHVFNLCLAITTFKSESDSYCKTLVVTDSKKASLAFNFGNSRDASVDKATRVLWHTVAIKNFDYSVTMENLCETRCPIKINSENYSDIMQCLRRGGTSQKLPNFSVWHNFFNLLF